MLAAMGVVYTSVFFPEIVNAHTAAGNLFGIIKRQPKTGDRMEGTKSVLFCTSKIFFMKQEIIITVKLREVGNYTVTQRKQKLSKVLVKIECFKSVKSSELYFTVNE